MTTPRYAPTWLRVALAAALAPVALIVGPVVDVWQERRARKERERS